VVGLLTPSLWFASLVTPGEEAVKIRNGLVAEMADPAAFDWEPAETPRTFKLNHSGPTARMREIVESIRSAEDGMAQGLELAVALSEHLMQTPRRTGGPIQAGLDTTYRRITEKGEGYCADFTRVFSGLAVASDLPVRTWSISFEAFGAGHSFNEIYDPVRSKWILIDPFHSLYFVDAESVEPLSVLELHERLILSGGEPRVAIRPIVGGKSPFKSDALALDYYRRGFRQLALVWGNNVFDYDRSSTLKWAAQISRHLERAVAIGLDVYPDLKIYPRGHSQRDFEALLRTKKRFFLAASMLVLSVLVFGYLLARTWLGSSSNAPGRSSGSAGL
jgi:hypothetical protein